MQRKVIDGRTPPWSLAVVRARRVRRIWQELTRAQVAGERMPTLAELCARCAVSSSSVAHRDVQLLQRMGYVSWAGLTSGSYAVGRNIRVLVPYHAQSFE